MKNSTQIFTLKKIQKEVSQCNCLSLILIDSVYKKGKNYHPQVFLEECKYIVTEKKMSNYITDDIDIFFDDSDKKNSDYSDENNYNEFK